MTVSLASPHHAEAAYVIFDMIFDLNIVNSNDAIYGRRQQRMRSNIMKYDFLRLGFIEYQIVHLCPLTNVL